MRMARLRRERAAGLKVGVVEVEDLQPTIEIIPTNYEVEITENENKQVVEVVEDLEVDLINENNKIVSGQSQDWCFTLYGARGGFVDEPKKVMENFAEWIAKNSKGKPTFISDNPAFDWQWINYYFHTYLGKNPFGFSARRIGDLYCGMKMDTGLNSEWKRLHRKITHDHNPVNDAKGNAEALLATKKMGLKLPTY